MNYELGKPSTFGDIIRKHVNPTDEERAAEAALFRPPTILRPMAVYIASPWDCKATSCAVRADLQGLGHNVTSSWLDEVGTGLPTDADLCRKVSRQDLIGIAAADVLLVLTDPRPIGVGHHVEFGYALAKGIPIIVAGPIKSVFHHLANCVYPSWPEAKQFFTFVS